MQLMLRYYNRRGTVIGHSNSNSTSIIICFSRTITTPTMKFRGPQSDDRIPEIIIKEHLLILIR